MKIGDKKTFMRILKEKGFSVLREGKHTIYSNGPKKIAVPSGKKFSRMLCQRLLKEIDSCIGQD